MRGISRAMGLAALVVASAVQAAPPKPKAVPPAQPVVTAPPADRMPIKHGMTFADMREATPDITWKMTPLANYAGRGFVRFLYGKSAAIVGGLPLDLLVVRGPTKEVENQKYTSAKMGRTKGACRAQIDGFAGSVASLAGKPPTIESWSNDLSLLPDRAPMNNNQNSTRYGDGLIHLSEEEIGARREFLPYQYGLEESPEANRKIASKTGLSEAYFNTQAEAALGWWGVLKQGDVSWVVIGRFSRTEADIKALREKARIDWGARLEALAKLRASGATEAEIAALAEAQDARALDVVRPLKFDAPDDTIGECQLQFETQSGDLSPSQSAPRYEYFTRDQLKDGGRLADRYNALLTRETNGAKDDEAGTYLCAVSLADNRLEACTKETPAPPQPKAAPPTKGQPVVVPPRPVAGKFLSSFAIPGPVAGEDDFVPRHARVQFAFLPSDTIPSFDWSKAKGNERAGVYMDRDIRIGSDDYPAFALRHEIEADAFVNCVVLDDLSVFCGNVEVVIVSGKVPEGSTVKPEAGFEREIRRALARGRTSPIAQPKKLDGTEARGTYFRRVIKFRVPK